MGERPSDRPQGMEGLKTGITVEAKPGGNLTTLAKRAYREATEWPKEKIDAAAKALATQLTEKEGAPKILKQGDQLTIKENHVELRRLTTMESWRVEWGKPEVEKAEKEEKVHEEAHKSAEDLRAEIEAPQNPLEQFLGNANRRDLEKILGLSVEENDPSKPILAIHALAAENTPKGYEGYQFHQVTVVSAEAPAPRPQASTRIEQRTLRGSDGSNEIVNVEVKGERPPAHILGGVWKGTELYAGYNPDKQKFALLEKRGGALKEFGQASNLRGFELLMKAYVKQKPAQTGDASPEATPQTGENLEMRLGKELKGKAWATLSDVSNPQFKIEAYLVNVEGTPYYIAAQRDKKPARYKLSRKNQFGDVVVNWTENFDKIKEKLV